MTNRIEWIDSRALVVPPSDAELTVTVRPAQRVPGTELRGRVMGPLCFGADTVQVAYPLRRVAESRPDILTARAVIPEASLWDPERPFLYRVFVELWQDGERLDRSTHLDGFRTIQFGLRGLKCNGFPLTLKGTRRLPNSREEAEQLRREGFNLLVAPVSQPEHWTTGTEAGFLVLGRMELTATALDQAKSLAREPSCLGWLIEPEPARVAASEELLSALRELGCLVAAESGDFLLLPDDSDADVLRLIPARSPA